MQLLIIYGVILVGLIFFYILPQRRKAAESAAMLAAIEEGDEVFMTSGIYGFVSAVDSDTLWVEVAPNIDIKVARSAIQGKIAPPGAADADDED